MSLVLILVLFMAFGLQECVSETLPDSTCCDLLNDIHAYTTYKNADLPSCNSAGMTETKCLELGLIQIFVQQANAFLLHNSDKIVLSKSEMKIPPLTSVSDIRNLLVLSFIGRYVSDVQTSEIKKEYLQFDTATNTLRFRRPVCEFEQPFYICMLTGTLLIIIFLTFADSLMHHYKERQLGLGLRCGDAMQSTMPLKILAFKKDKFVSQ